MAKRNAGTTRTTRGTTDAVDAPGADAMERRLLAFAEQLGRIAGNVQARAEGWMDREALQKQMAGVRDGAAGLLKQLAGATKTPAKKPRASAARPRGRSGGVVDAPGKKHRKPQPTDTGRSTADSQAAKMRTAKTMVKTHRRRGRG
jgi:hypothetical protein